jgi:hypothetical protein
MDTRVLVTVCFFATVFHTLSTALRYHHFENEDIHPFRILGGDGVFEDLCISAILAKRSYKPPGKEEDECFLEEMHGDAYTSHLTQDDVAYFDARQVGEDNEHTNVYVWISANVIDTKDTDTFSSTLSEYNRTAYVIFRGTEDSNDMLANIDIRRREFMECGVHFGFLRQFRAVEEHVSRFLQERVGKYDRIVFTGHSLGGALATIAAMEAVVNNKTEVPVYCHTFGSPRVGDASFSALFNDAAETTHQRPNRRAVSGREGKTVETESVVTESITQKNRIDHINHWRVFDYADPVPMIPISNMFRHVGCNTLCLGEKTQCRVEKSASNCDDTHWLCRPVRGVLSVDFTDPIRAHDITGYIAKLKRADAFSYSASTRGSRRIRSPVTGSPLSQTRSSLCVRKI